jgi:hypothetical protein
MEKERIRLAEIEGRYRDNIVYLAFPTIHPEEQNYGSFNFI